MCTDELTDINHYTVVYLFDLDLKNVLLVRKTRTEFKGQLNGCGGAIEFGEDGYSSALREIREETGISSEGLREMPDDGSRLLWLGNLILPHDCKAGQGLCGLHLYTGIVMPSAMYGMNKKTDAGEDILWEPMSDILASTAQHRRYAGEGDLQYFVGQAVKRLHQEFGWRDPGMQP